jgi:hypothetical protein
LQNSVVNRQSCLRSLLGIKLDERNTLAQACRRVADASDIHDPFQIARATKMLAELRLGDLEGQVSDKHGCFRVMLRVFSLARD